LKVP